MALKLRRFHSFLAMMELMALMFVIPWTALASDHNDTPQVIEVGRQDANTTDLYAFPRSNDLVLSLCTNPAIPVAATEYFFPSDLTLRILVDNNSEVRFDNSDDLIKFGGTIVNPQWIEEDIVFEITFDKQGSPQLNLKGLPGDAREHISLFAGLRDDPFIRGPRIGQNIAAVVIELPLSYVLDAQPTLLIWATSQIPEINGPMADLDGRALRSQFPENLLMNTIPPRDVMKVMGVQPDVIIYDVSRPAAFPNGRELTDDVVDLVGDPRVLSNDYPFPSQNDVPFLTSFPYLAPPHSVPEPASMLLLGSNLIVLVGYGWKRFFKK